MYRFVFVILLTTIICSGCMKNQRELIPFQVTSEPSNALIEVNGVNVGHTPIQITLINSKRWVGIINAPGGWAYTGETYNVTAFPPRDATEILISQTKQVTPLMFPQGGNIFFDLRPESARTKQPVELK